MCLYLCALCALLDICEILTVVFFPGQVLTAQDLVDFSPVYRCLHIYTVLVGVPVSHARIAF